MTLFSDVQNSLGQLNKPIKATLFASIGTKLKEDFSTEIEEKQIPLMINVQSNPSSSLQEIQSITQQNDQRVIYAPSIIHALDRPLQIGGDRLYFFNSFWLVSQILEEWDNASWSKILVIRQTAPTSPPQTPAKLQT